MAAQPFWNPADKSGSATLSNSDRTSSQAAFTTGAARSTTYQTAGKWYVECVVTSNIGFRFGLATSGYSVTASPGGSTTSWVVRGNEGDKINNNSAQSYGAGFSVNDVAMLAVDLAAGRVWWGRNGSWFASGNPGAGTGAAYTSLASSLALIFGCNAGTGIKVGTLTAVGSYAYSPPSGFTSGWGSDGIEGAVALSESNDSVSSAGALYIVATGSSTEANDSLAAAGALSIKGTASLSEAGDSLSAVIQITPVLGAAGLTESDDSLSASGRVAIAGAAGISEAADSLASTGALHITAAGSAIEAEDSLAAEGALAIHGDLSRAEADDSIASAGALAISGVADLPEDADSVEASDFVPGGRADLVEEDDYIRAAGEIPASWMQEQATKGDIPNWNHCARCYKEVRPNELIRQTRRTGSSITWTGIYVCNDCLDPIHPQDRWPRKMAGDPKPVPNARPWKGS